MKYERRKWKKIIERKENEMKIMKNNRKENENNENNNNNENK